MAEKKTSANCVTTKNKGYEPSRTIGYKKDYKVTGTTDKKKASK